MMLTQEKSGYKQMNRKKSKLKSIRHWVTYGGVTTYVMGVLAWNVPKYKWYMPKIKKMPKKEADEKLRNIGGVLQMINHDLHPDNRL
jgi:helix-turn-helix protein